MRFAEMTATCRATAVDVVEVVGVLDVDDPALDAYEAAGADKLHITERGVRHSDLWNRGYRFADGDLVMMAGDDLRFETPGWDAAVAEAVDERDDGIMLAWCNDGSEFGPVATHPVVSRAWVWAVGTFTPPYYHAWNADSWLLDLGIKTGRLAYLEEVMVRHMHVDYGLAADDATYRRARSYREAYRQPLCDRPGFADREPERERQAALLRRAMTGSSEPTDTWHRYVDLYESHGYRVGAFRR